MSGTNRSAIILRLNATSSGPHKPHEIRERRGEESTGLYRQERGDRDERWSSNPIRKCPRRPLVVTMPRCANPGNGGFAECRKPGIADKVLSRRMGKYCGGQDGASGRRMWKSRRRKSGEEETGGRGKGMFWAQAAYMVGRRWGKEGPEIYRRITESAHRIVVFRIFWQWQGSSTERWLAVECVNSAGEAARSGAATFQKRQIGLA
ncbi:hypothetical protein BS47DRAFT_1362100 [Hydnum rufescens UP504]|uniref:Uncharacterized protein n=1 Tax=Hydnum rufescens UP504 TaxID=1448309 RepID=A0A9P6DXG5_9AGAM|nr:hypothetical protein BS47DRAFT_1362100 [Hydnum rufescens UP504]